MASQIKTLIEPTVLDNTPTSYYTAGASTRIDQCTVANPSATNAYHVTIYWTKGSDTPGTANQVQPSRLLTPSEAYNVLPFIGQVLSSGDQIYAMADGPLNLFASGTVISQ